MTKKMKSSATGRAGMKSSIRLLLVCLCTLYFYVNHVYYYEQYQQSEVYSAENSTWNFHPRQKHVKAQINSIAAGNYLKKDGDNSNWLYSFVQDDVGTYLGLADLAYAKKALLRSSFKFTIKDYFLFQFLVFSLAIGCMFLPIVRLRISIAAFLSLALAQSSGYIDWLATNQSFSCVSVVLAFVLFLSLLDILRKTAVTWIEMLQIAFSAFYLGCLGVCRSDAKYYALAAIASLFFLLLSTIALLLLNKENRGLIRKTLISGSRRSWMGDLWNLYAVRLLAGCVLIAFSLTIPVKIALSLNQKFFEHVEKIEIRNDNAGGGHILWQAIYMGLGATHKSLSDRTMDPWNHENVVYSETGAAAQAWTTKTHDNSLLWTKQYNVSCSVSAWEQLFTQSLWNNPIDYLRSYYSKFISIYKKSETLHLLCLVIFLFSLFRNESSPSRFYYSVAIQTVSVSLLAMAAIPGILLSASFDGSLASNPLYLSGYQTGLAAYPLLMMALATIRHDRPVSDGFKNLKVDYRRILSAFLVTFGALTLLLGVAGAGFLCWKQVTVFHLQQDLQSGETELSSLFEKSYHADLVRSINGLPAANREAVIRNIMKAPIGDPVTLINTDGEKETGNIKIESVKKVRDHLFLMIRTSKDLRNTAIPLNIKDPSLKINGLVVLPPRLQPGQWVFSVLVGAEKDVIRVLTPITMTKYNIYESKDPAPNPIAEIHPSQSLSDTIAATSAIANLYPLRKAAEKDAETLLLFEKKENEILSNPAQLRAPLIKGIEIVDFRWERLTPKQPDGMAQFEGSFLLRITEQPSSWLNKDLALTLWFQADAKYKDLFQKSGVSFPGFGFSLAKLPVQSWKKGDYYLAKRPYRVLDVPYQLKMGLSADGKLLSPWVELGQYPPAPAP